MRVLAVVGVGLLAVVGCASTFVSRMPGMGQYDMRPGLRDVKVLGPRGQKCYDFCASAEATCKQMCPGNQTSACKDDCITDTKNCLSDCPELEAPPVMPR